MKDWRHINLRITNALRRLVDRAAVEIDCTRADWIRGAIKHFRKLSPEEQIEAMKEKE